MVHAFMLSTYDRFSTFSIMVSRFSGVHSNGAAVLRAVGGVRAVVHARQLAPAIPSLEASLHFSTLSGDMLSGYTPRLVLHTEHCARSMLWHTPTTTQVNMLA